MENLILLNKDIEIGIYKNNRFESIIDDMLPLYLKNGGDFELWLSLRAIDPHRSTSRFLKKALRISLYSDIDTVLRVNAVTITDNYWVKPMGSKLQYQDVVFDKKYYSQRMAKSFAKLALTGSGDSLNYLMLNNKVNKTPELTNIGSFEKCWKYEKDCWWLYKIGNRFEKFSEIFIYNFGKLLGFDMAYYEKFKLGVKTKDFTNNRNFNFEPAFNFVNEETDYEYVYNKLIELAPYTIKDYVQMIYLDVLVRNYDRHTLNFGILRDSNSGEIVSFAPNFDNNNALISRGYLLSNPNSRKNDAMVKSFNEFINSHNELKKYLVSFDEQIIKKAIDLTRMKIKKQFVIDFIMIAYKQIDL